MSDSALSPEMSSKVAGNLSLLDRLQERWKTIVIIVPFVWLLVFF